MFLNTNYSGHNKLSGEVDENFILVLPKLERMVIGGVSIVADGYRTRGKVS